MELVGVRAQPDSIDLLIPLVAEPGFNDVLGEDIATEQKLVIDSSASSACSSEPGVDFTSFASTGGKS